ncbi:MAG: ATPase [Aestuariivirga sp.]|uniref:ATPase n=1 Tax=Aestuariivirga sp. TaxID=2650926 RepID=UPI0025C3CB76|nr:ATPase [Aestuariivirga sp.]MCA3562009.1 ATPase [Aestuariivirga sp.]
MRFTSGKDFANQPHKSVTIFGMSGVGKTTLSNLLQDSGWYHYSVDYRIGTRYMGEHIVDNFKREAMRVPFLRDLLLSDSIHIQSNITFDHLKPLSTYLGKPGNPDKGGISFAEYKTRQAQHRAAEIASLLDVPTFIGKARDIYRYNNFVCDSGGSLCEVVDPTNPLDPVLSCLAGNALLLYIEGTPEHTRMLVERFRKHPKPMYYQPQFLETKWAEYKALNGIAKDDDVDPDGFAVWGFEQLLHHRIPLYKAIAGKFGYTVRMRDVPSVQSEEDFIALVANAIEK